MSQRLLQHYAIEAEMAQVEAAYFRSALMLEHASSVGVVVKLARKMASDLNFYSKIMHRHGLLSDAELEEDSGHVENMARIAQEKIDGFRQEWGHDYDSVPELMVIADA